MIFYMFAGAAPPSFSHLLSSLSVLVLSLIINIFTALMYFYLNSGNVVLKQFCMNLKAIWYSKSDIYEVTFTS